MNWSASDAAMVGKLIAKDWQVYQKQLAGYVAGLLLALGLVGMGSPLLSAAGLVMFAGIVLFSGSLYLLSLTGTHWLGAVTPIGGAAFLAAWAMVALAAYRAQG